MLVNVLTAGDDVSEKLRHTATGSLMSIRRLWMRHPMKEKALWVRTAYLQHRW